MRLGSVEDEDETIMAACRSGVTRWWCVVEPGWACAWPCPAWGEACEQQEQRGKGIGQLRQDSQ